MLLLPYGHAESAWVQMPSVQTLTGTETTEGIVAELLENASVPVLLKPNAGLPEDGCGGGLWYAF